MWWQFRNVLFESNGIRYGKDITVKMYGILEMPFRKSWRFLTFRKKKTKQNKRAKIEKKKSLERVTIEHLEN